MDPASKERERCLGIVRSQLEGTQQLPIQRVLTRVINLISRGEISSPRGKAAIPSTPSELAKINAIVAQEVAKCRADSATAAALNRTLHRIKTEAFGEAEGPKTP